MVHFEPCEVFEQDFFKIMAPAGVVERALAKSLGRLASGSKLVLSLVRDDRGVDEVQIGGRAVPVLPFPLAAKSLADIASDSEGYSDSEAQLTLLLPRKPFDLVADQHGARRIAGLSLSPGKAAADPVFINLAACLAASHGATSAVNTLVIDRIAGAFFMHLALRYGGLNVPGERRPGCLAPWQLRLARDKLSQFARDGAAPLEAVARACGLSLSHFSRAFTRTTGMPPHRWLIQRRIELAKELIRDSSEPLAEIALACGFCDQSHFTRAFSKATGMTPTQWRKSQAKAPVRGPNREHNEQVGFGLAS